KRESDSSTNRAQGGIAAVLSGADSFESHVADTLEAGAGLCRRDVVETIVREAPDAIRDLVEIGVRFTRTAEGYALGREGGHRAARVVHADDLTGQEIERALLAAIKERRGQIDVYRDHIALDLIKGTADGTTVCAGAYVFSEKDHSFYAFYAPVTLLATGGLGQVYFHTSNPKIATGDGVAMAYRAGVPVGNLEFIQFHPTILYSPGRWPFLISEAVRGEGGVLKAVDGRLIMDGAHELKDLAPRDIVARAIDKELKQSGEEYVLLDISHRDAAFIKKRFPNIYKQCLQRGFDLTRRPIPVVPAAHYACGGVVSRVSGETALAGLYVAGEVAMTGMHGANRLASNSLLEAVVMAKRAAAAACAYAEAAPPAPHAAITPDFYSSLQYPREKVLLAHDRSRLTRVMWDFVGIVRTENRLRLALEEVQRVKNAVEQYYLATPATYQVVELRNMATVAELIVRSALLRKESRGLHYIEDYPAPAPGAPTDTIITNPHAQG
ncbi:MAG TPA: L-aspartate oxidase, partial [candidate division Zixibacteria bacterium]|nr:L-aspartate oxidase [candidate division Zixibacteria bacterium]